MNLHNKHFHLPIWKDEEGNRISCDEKIRVMKENFDEIYLALRDLYDDAILMNIEPIQVKETMMKLISML